MLTLKPISKDVICGGHKFTVTALPLGVLRRVIMPLADKLKTDLTAIDPDTFDTMLKYAHMSVSQSNPEITVEDLENCLMFADFIMLFQAVIEVSGLIRDTTVGEVISPLSQSNSGDGSTGISSHQPDGHMDTWMGS
ncbi:MAG: hypothetical protein LBB40_02150 [Holophagales bacterium]|jgi:hypothetical protein|nr:hypothetical protein [Holophagales bacterium]